MPEGEFDTKHDAMMTNESDDIVSESSGKITANGNAPDKVVDAAAKSGYDELKSFIKKWSSPGRTLYAVTPRTTNMPEQMQASLGSRKEAPGLHVSGNRTELAEVKELYAECSTPMIVWITDPGGTCTFLGKSWYDFIGPTRESPLGSGWLDAVHPDDRAYIHDRFARANAQRAAFRLEFRLHCKDGEFRWGVVAATPRFAANNRFLGYIGSVVDITEHQQAEAAVRAKSERLISALESSGTGTFCWDICTGAMTWDDVLDRLLGIRSGKTARSLDQFLALVHPGERQGVIERCERCRTSGADFEMEFRVIWPNGRVRWFYGRGKTIIGEGNRPAYLTGTCVDISERKATELSSESETRFEALADAARVLIWMSGADKLRTWFNKPWLNFVGRSMEQELANGWLQNVHTDDAARCCETYSQAYESRLPFTRSYRLKRYDGEYRFVLDKAIPVFGPSGNFTGYLGCCIDITEQKEVEEALKEANRRKDEFLTNMSHEIRSPMTSILAYADILLRHLKDPEDIECVQTIKQGGNHLLELISDILDLSKIGSGKLKINKGIVSLPTLLNEVHSLMAVRAQEKKLPLVLTYEGAVPENVETDRTRLRQIVLNLVSNAIKFTEAGSVQIIARFLPEESALEVEVADTGIGISREQQGRLFQPFMQVDSTTRGHEGTGLGLAITKQLVDMLDGAISFESAPNRGSTFRVKMPVAPVRSTTAGTDNGAKCAVTRRKVKILLVDDNQMVCRAMARLLAMSGHEVATAFDGRSALKTARDFQADVIVLDLRLPDMGGYELLKRLKTLKSLQHTKYIALTGFGEEFRQSGDVEFDHFLTKPVDTKELEGLLIV